MNYKALLKELEQLIDYFENQNFDKDMLFQIVNLIYLAQCKLKKQEADHQKKKNINRVEEIKNLLINGDLQNAKTK